MKRFLLSALLWAMCSAGAFADGTINISSPVDSPSGGWTWSSPTLTITKDGSYAITGSTTANRVVVDSGVTASITLSGVSIDVSDSANACAFNVVTTATVALILSGANVLKSSGDAAGLQVNAGATLTVTSDSGDGSEADSLQAFGGQNEAGARGAGIGGAKATSAGAITINGGSVEARGGYGSVGCGAGIGGGGAQEDDASQVGGSGGAITINGGRVTATSERGGAGIGGGYKGSGGSITISGGIVTASTGRSNGDPAAIGGGGFGDAGTITITGGAVVALADSGGAFSGGYGSDSGSINISGGTIIATGKIGIGADSGRIKTTITSAPVIFAVEINGDSSDPASGVATGSHVSITDSSITLNTSFTVPDSAVLTIPPGWTLSCGSNSLTNSGTIINYGNSIACVSNNPLHTEITDTRGHGTAQNITNIVSGSRAIRPYPDPSATGYTFGGWYKDDSCVSAWLFGVDVIGSDTTLYAKWTANTYQLYFDAQGGTVSRDSQPVAYGSKLDSLPTPARPSYPFGGWYTQAGGGGDRYTDTTVYDTAGNTTIYALWGQPVIYVDSAFLARKIYDGTGSATVDSVWFKTLATEAKLTLNKGGDYAVNSAFFTSKNVGGSDTVKIFVSLKNSSYVLQDSLYLLTNQRIEQAAPDTSHLIFARGSSVAYDGLPHGAPVSLKSKYTGMDSIVVLYNGSAGLPDGAGEYAVTVDIRGNVNFRDTVGLALDTFTIYYKADTSLAVTYADPPFWILTPELEEKWNPLRWRSFNPEVIAVDTTGMITIRGVGVAHMVIDTGDQHPLALTARVEVQPKQLTVANLWVDTVKAYDANKGAAVLCILQGMLPGDADSVRVISTACYSIPIPQPDGTSIIVTHRVEGSRAYCYLAPSSDTVRGVIKSDSLGTCDVWGMVVKQESSGDAPWPGVRISYTVSDGQQGELTTDAYGRYILSGLSEGSTVWLTAPPQYSYTCTPAQPQAVVVTLTPSLTQAGTIRYAPDGVSLLSLSLADEGGSILSRWGREGILDTIFYELPCHRRSVDVGVSCELQPGVRGSYTVTVALLAGGTKEATGGWTNSSTFLFRAPLDSLARTLISVTLRNTASGKSKRYTIVLSKDLGLFDVINERLGGRLRVVDNDPNKNSTGLTFSACTWWHKRDGGIWSVGEEKQLYYTAGSSLLDKFTERDSMFLVLTLSNGGALETCRDANRIAANEDGGDVGSASKKSNRVAIYPNPVPSGGIIKFKQSGLADGEEEEERYVKYSLFSSQGSLVLSSGDASLLYEGQGLAMPQAPGVYHLLLEGKNGKRWVAKVAVGESHVSY